MKFVDFILKSLIISLVFSVVDAKRRKNRNHGRVSKNILNSESDVKICKTSAKYVFDESMYLLPYFEAKKRQEHHVRGVYRLKDFSCKKGFKQSPNRSTCPWHYVLNYAENRIPSMVLEAECSCTNCLTENSEGLNACEKIYTYRTVLIKKKGEKCYERHIKGFPVGCHCVGSSRLPPLDKVSTDDK